jgi:hypothetical protein
MANKSDVKLDVGLDGVTPVGISLNFSVGAIPTCLVDLAPAGPGIIKIMDAASGVLADPDGQKRKEVDVSISVRSRDGSGNSTNRKLKWTGLLDGMTIGNTVGNNSYQAVLKGKAQTLLELTTLTPGLFPTSVDIYKNPFFSMLNSTQDDSQAEIAFVNVPWSKGLKPTMNPIEFYTSFLKAILEHQQGGYAQFLGDVKTVDAQQPLDEIFKDGRYQKAIAEGVRLMGQIDYSYVTGGTIADTKSSYPAVLGAIKAYFTTGPNVILENYMNFLNFLGCSLVFGKEKIFVVPDKSFIKQPHTAPGKKVSSTTPNVANPADYNSYIYNDNGYRDICAVILSNPMPLGGAVLTDKRFELGLVGCYVDKKTITKASGVLVAQDHPFSMYMFNTESAPKDNKEMKERADSGGESYYPKGLKYGEQEDKENQKKRANEKSKAYRDQLKKVLTNYAETKFYQARYGDRQGTITIEFNPNWAPGACGVLYVRETQFFLDFYVESVTHRIDMTPPAGGTAITVINFSCGRMGTSPIGVDKDEFLGYDKGKESSFVQGFIGDIGAS